MDVLTHLFLPLTVLYVLRADFFDGPSKLPLAGFGLFSDLDKYLGVPGLLHSILTIGLVSLGLLAAERWWRGHLLVTPIIIAFLWSHIVLDLFDGGPVPLFAPLSDQGLGFIYPVRVAFGTGLLGVSFEGPLVALQTASPRGGYNAYGFVNGAGVASLLAFVCIYLGDRWQRGFS